MNFRPVIPDGIVPTLCRMCDTRCAVNVHLHNKVIKTITPMPGHPNNQGRMCPRGGAAVDMFYHPDRLLTPLKKGPDGRFVPIPMDQALDEIADRLSRIAAANAPAAVGVWKGESVGFFQQEAYARRFIRAFGSPNYFSNDSVCYNGRALGYRLVTGFYSPFPDFT